MPDNWGLKLVIYVPMVISLMLGVAYCTALQPLAKPPSPSPPPRPAPISNRHVASELNSADLYFRGRDKLGEAMGCLSVSSAIDKANNPEDYGTLSDADRAELRRYADRCGLRF
jgi:hypothetical protein